MSDVIDFMKDIFPELPAEEREHIEQHSAVLALQLEAANPGTTLNNALNSGTRLLAIMPDGSRTMITGKAVAA